MSTTLTIVPRMSEKTYASAQGNTYVFNVPTTANKQQIAAAVAAQFNVTVESVNTIVAKGKRVRSVRKGGKPVTGTRRNVKKAYVTLAEGSRLSIFDEGEKK
jgi:large subunit ribosomal protein L23